MVVFILTVAASVAALLGGWRPRGTCRVHQPAAGAGATAESIQISRERSFRFLAGSIEVESTMEPNGRLADIPA